MYFIFVFFTIFFQQLLSLLVDYLPIFKMIPKAGLQEHGLSHQAHLLATSDSQLDNVDKSPKIQDVAKGCGGSRTHTPRKFNIASKKGNLFLKGNSSSHLQFSGSMLNFRGV